MFVYTRCFCRAYTGLLKRGADQAHSVDVFYVLKQPWDVTIEAVTDAAAAGSAAADAPVKPTIVLTETPGMKGYARVVDDPEAECETILIWGGKWRKTMWITVRSQRTKDKQKIANMLWSSMVIPASGPCFQTDQALTSIRRLSATNTVLVYILKCFGMFQEFGQYSREIRAYVLAEYNKVWSDKLLSICLFIETTVLE